MKYAVVFEKAETNWAAYVPDLPGCVCTADTLELCKQEIAVAIRLHLDGIEEDGFPVPDATAITDYIAA